jgi:hypothetical protein
MFRGTPNILRATGISTGRDSAVGI